MEFGKLDIIDGIDWSLPAVSPQTFQFLSQQSKSSKFDLRFGTPAWAHREWIGKIYPEGSKPADFLRLYSSQYRSVEFNSSHYQIPTQQQTTKWLEKVPADFLFCAKVYQGISHAPKGLQNHTLLKAWLSFLERLGSHCGPSFLQLPPFFDYSRKAELHQFLKLWPREFKLALEFRHPSWFEKGSILPLLAEYLFQRGIGVVVTDVSGRRDVLHSTVTSDFLMVRFIGNALHPSDQERMQLWTERLQLYRDQGLNQAFLFLHEPSDVLCPEMTNIAVDLLNAKMNLKLNRVGCQNPLSLFASVEN